MLGIFDDERRGSGPMAPDPSFVETTKRDGALFRQSGVAGHSWRGTPPRGPLLTLAKNRSRQTHHLFLNR
jgi:hypothetical protein